MRESAQSIAAWADEALGLVYSDAQVWTRANVEMALLLDAAIAGADQGSLAEKAADIAIVLARLSVRIGHEIIFPDYGPYSGASAIPYTNVAMANLYVSIRGNCDSWLVRSNLVTVLQGLAAITMFCGRSLAIEIDRKMEINRQFESDAA